MAQRVRADINMYQGDARSYKFSFFTDTAKTTAWNISAASSVKMGVKSSLDQPSVLFEVSATNGANGNDWTNGIVVFEVPANMSITLTKNGKYDVQVTLASKPLTPVYGDVLLQKQVVA